MDIKEKLNKLVPHQHIAVDEIVTELDKHRTHSEKENKPINFLFMNGDSKEYQKMFYAIKKVMKLNPAQIYAGFLNQKAMQIQALPAFKTRMLVKHYIILADDTFTDSDEYLLESAKEGSMSLQFALKYIEKRKGKYIPELLNQVSTYVLFNADNN